MKKVGDESIACDWTPYEKKVTKTPLPEPAEQIVTTTTTTTEDLPQYTTQEQVIFKIG